MAYGPWPEVGRATPDLDGPYAWLWLGWLEHLCRESYSGFIVLTVGNEWFSVETDNNTWDDDNCDSYLVALVSALEASR